MKLGIEIHDDAYVELLRRVAHDEAAIAGYVARVIHEHLRSLIEQEATADEQRGGQAQLDEFRTALEREIKAKVRAQMSKVPY